MRLVGFFLLLLLFCQRELLKHWFSVLFLWSMFTINTIRHKKSWPISPLWLWRTCDFQTQNPESLTLCSTLFDNRHNIVLTKSCILTFMLRISPTLNPPQMCKYMATESCLDQVAWLHSSKIKMSDTVAAIIHLMLWPPTLCYGAFTPFFSLKNKIWKHFAVTSYFTIFPVNFPCNWQATGFRQNWYLLPP